MSSLLGDLKHAIRLYARTPGASLIAVVVLAVGMAFVGAFLSLYVDVAMRDYAGLEDGRQLVTLGQTDGRNFQGFPIAMTERMGDEMSSLEGAVAGGGAAVTDLQGILGHTDLTTTQIYAHMVDTRARASLVALDYGVPAGAPKSVP